MTNQHVVAAAPPDPQTGVGKVMIYFGQIKDGWMELLDEPIPATVYKTGIQRPGPGEALAEPGGNSDCPWCRWRITFPCRAQTTSQSATPRPARYGLCQRSGFWPRCVAQEKLDVILATLSATPSDRKKISRLLASVPQRTK